MRQHSYAIEKLENFSLIQSKKRNFNLKIESNEIEDNKYQQSKLVI